MVRGLVEQEDVGLADERPRQEDAPLHARRQVVEPGLGLQSHPRDDRPDPIIRARGMPAILQPFGHLVGDGLPRALGDLLRQPPDPQPLLADDLPLVGRDLPRDQAEQQVLASPFRPEQADALPRSICKPTLSSAEAPER